MKMFSTKQLCAYLLGCRENEILAFRQREDGSAVVVGPTGQKFLYSPAHLHSAVEELNQLNLPFLGSTPPQPYKPTRSPRSKPVGLPRRKV